jgi:hypothetical protein
MFQVCIEAEEEAVLEGAGIAEDTEVLHEVADTVEGTEVVEGDMHPTKCADFYMNMSQEIECALAKGTSKVICTI